MGVLVMNDDLPHLETCFREGTRARAKGSTHTDNPYRSQTAEHREWRAGWAATLDLDEDDDPESTRVKPGLTDTDADSDTI